MEFYFQKLSTVCGELHKSDNRNVVVSSFSLTTMMNEN